MFTKKNHARAIALLLASLLLPTTAAVAQRAPAPAQTHATSASAPTEAVNVNTATLEQLVTLPGVGPARAQAILDLRKQLGGFKKLEDLMRVKGIGRKTFQKLAPMMKL